MPGHQIFLADGFTGARNCQALRFFTYYGVLGCQWRHFRPIPIRPPVGPSSNTTTEDFHLCMSITSVSISQPSERTGTCTILTWPVPCSLQMILAQRRIPDAEVSPGTLSPWTGQPPFINEINREDLMNRAPFYCNVYTSCGFVYLSSTDAEKKSQNKP